MKKEKRQQLILKRKNFLPSLLITVLLGLILIGIVYFAEPNNSFIVFVFFLCVFSFLFFLFSLLLASSRRGFIFSFLITLFLILRMYGVGNILNLILLFSLGIIAEIYARIKK